MQSLDDRIWERPLARCFAELGAAPSGLTEREAQDRLRRFGPNVAVAEARQPLWLQFLLRFTNPLILILLLASLLSAVTGDLTSFVLILLIIAASVVLDFVQEVQAANAAAALRAQVALKARVLRDGAETQRGVESLAPVLRQADALLAFGSAASALVLAFANEAGLAQPSVPRCAPDEALYWSRSSPGGSRVLKLQGARQSHDRHRGKYAAGDVGEAHSYYFRTKTGECAGRARNLAEFVVLAHEVPDGVWERHLQTGDYGRWFIDIIRDEELARSAARGGRSGIREQVLEPVSNATEGMSASAVLEALQATEKSAKVSARNALAALKKGGKLVLENGIYNAAVAP